MMKSFERMLLSVAMTLPSHAALSQPGPRQGRECRFDQDNTRGWPQMTSQERAAHRDGTLPSKTDQECKAYQEEHHALRAVRAKEKGQTLASPAANACNHMKAPGRVQVAIQAALRLLGPEACHHGGSVSGMITVR